MGDKICEQLLCYKEHRLSGELTIEEFKDSEKMLIRKHNRWHLRKNIWLQIMENLFQLVVNFLDYVQNWMKMY